MHLHANQKEESQMASSQEDFNPAILAAMNNSEAAMAAVAA